MEFKDLATKFEGLTADQVGVLAEFGKNILDDAGIFGLPSYLLGLIQDMLNTDEFDIEENRLTIRSLLHIVELANDLNMRCWGEQKPRSDLRALDMTTNMSDLKMRLK